jgi:hypothetical protein
LRFAFLDRTTRGEQEAVPADLKIGDLVAQDCSPSATVRQIGEIA